MSRKRICFVTSSRAEYGATRWLIDAVDKSKNLDLLLLVTGSHLSTEFGETYQEIERDGYLITEKVDMLLSSKSEMAIVKGAALCLLGVSDFLQKERPDAIVVTGDRYELLSICTSALLLKIPIIHISGGDITLGAIDNQVRNAITMMSSIHFPVVKEAAENVIRMQGNNGHVYVLGEPGLENFLKLSLMDRTVLATDLPLNLDKKWILLTCHPETCNTLNYNLLMIENALQELLEVEDAQIIVTKSNFDYGGMQMNDYVEKAVKRNPDRIKLIASLGQLRYLSLMKEVVCVVGNSSSAIIETPYLKTPAINIGNRQKGRYMCENVISCGISRQEISDAYNLIFTSEYQKRLFSTSSYYGNGKSSEIFINVVEHEFGI